MLYKEKTFDFDETQDAFNLIVSLLKKAISEGKTVKTEKNNLLHNGFGNIQCVKCRILFFKFFFFYKNINYLRCSVLIF